MAWETPQWCLYDVLNEMVLWLNDEENDEPTDEQLRRNVFKMPTAQVKKIRHAKGLPMPCPPVDVVWVDLKDAEVKYDPLPRPKEPAE